MWLFLSVLAVCLTVVYLHRSGFSLPAPSLRVEVAAAPTFARPLPDDPAEIPMPRAPRAVLEFCARESEAFMQDKLLNDAYDYYKSVHGDHSSDEDRWAVVLTMLEQTVGDVTMPHTADEVTD